MNDLSSNEEYYRVFAFGPGHGALISERFSKDAADKRRREWQKSIPHADVRIEKVNANGWSVCDMVLSVSCPRCGPVMLGVQAWSYQDERKLVTEYRTVCKCGQEVYGFVPRNQQRNREVSSVAKPPHIVITVSCPHCQQKQVVQVRARTGFAQMADQTVRCVKCQWDFSVMVPDQIIGGPFFP